MSVESSGKEALALEQEGVFAKTFLMPAKSITHAERKPKKTQTSTVMSFNLPPPPFATR
jgi:hypothetical protein